MSLDRRVSGLRPRVLLALAAVVALVAGPVLAVDPARGQTAVSVSANPSTLEGPGSTTVTATIPHDPVESVDPPAMTFTLDGPGGTQTERVTTSTPDDERRIRSYVTKFALDTAGEYTVTATAGGLGSGTTTVTVRDPQPPPPPPPPPIEVVLQKTSAPTQAGGVLEVRATARNAEDGYWYVEVVEGPHAGLVLADDATANPVTVRYTGERQGTDTIRAVWRFGIESSARGEIKHTWEPPPEPTVVLTQDSERSAVGTTLTVTAVVENVTGGSWTISVDGANGPLVLLTDRSDREVTVSYTGRRPGQDTITATWTYRSGDEFSDTAADTVTHSWIPPEPEVVLAQSSGSSLVGTPLEITVRVTGGEGRGGGRLTLRVSGANPQRSLPVSGEGSPFTATYTGTRTGTDTITATWTDEFGTVERSTTHTWTEPRIEVSVDAATADLGETATVRVRLPDGTAGRSVRIRVVEGPHEGDLTTTGSGTEFSARYTGRSPGTDVIAATLVSDEPVVTSGGRAAPAAQASITWSTPAVVLDQDTVRSPLGTTHTVTARVTGTVTGDLDVRVSGANAGATVTRSGELPTFTLEYSGRVAGTDQITASVTVGDRAYTSEPLTHSWAEPTVRLSQQTTASQVREQLLVTATVGPSGVPGAVTFTVDGAGEEQTFRDDTPADGYTVSYTRTQPGTDRIRAVFTTAGGIAFPAVPVEHEWTREPRPAVVLSPAGATPCTGSPFTATVTVTDDGEPQADVPVRVTATPDRPGEDLGGTTTEDGRTTVQYARGEAGEETLVATAELGSGTVTSAPTTVLWEDCGLVVTLGPAGRSSPVDTPFTATVVVTGTDGTPVSDARVEWAVTMPGQPEITPAPTTTDESGSTSRTWTRSEPGADLVAVTVTSGDREGRAVTDHLWTEESEVQLRLQPDEGSAVTRSPATVTALVTRDGRPLPDVELSFRASMPPPVDGEPVDDVIGPPQRSGPDGQTSFTWTREVAGVDTVDAEAVVDGRTLRASALYAWTAVPDLEFRLEPAGTSGQVRTDVTVTATVLDGGEPAAGAEVSFRATKPDEPEVAPPPQRVDAEGHASLTYTREEVGPDVVRATVVLPDGRRGEASVSRLWLAGGDEPVIQPPPEPPTVRAEGGLVPGGLATIRGTGCPADADVVLTIDGDPVATTRADGNGDHRTRVRLGDLAVGRHELIAECLPERARAPLDVVVPSSSVGTAGAATVTTMAVFGFFVLLGGQLVRPSGGQTPGGGS